MSLRRRVALPVLVCLFALCFASPAAAQFSGTWTGTFVHRSPFASENACVRTGPITITLNSNGSASGSLSAVFDKTTFCQPASNTTQVATISPGSISNNILSGSLISTFFGNVQYQAVVSSNALFFTAPGANSEFHAMLFLPATSAAPPADLRGTWNGTVRENVVYCHSNILIDGTTEITFAQNANTFTAMLVVDMANDETNCQLTPSEGSQAGTFGGTIDGNTFVGTLMEDRNLGAISGVMSGSEINFTFSFPVDEPDLPNKSEILDSVWTAKVTRGTAAPAPSIPTFTATPSTIVAGDSATLSWTTQDATSASINQGINSVALSGSRSVSPTVTTTYTLTATGATAPAATKTATVTVTPCVQPNLVVTAFPIGMLQAVGGALPSDSFTLTNVGATSGTITLTKTGSFFTQTPSTFTIAAGASQVVSITAITQPAGFYPGSSIVSACGSATGLSIPINLRVAAPPTAPVTITASDARTEVASPGAGGTVTFTNPGTSTIQGLVITDVPWIIIPTPDLTLNAAETKQVAFTIDRSKRPDAAALTGGIAGSVYFRYVNIGSGTLSLPEPSAQTTAPGSPVISVVTVVVVDVVKTASIGDNAPPLNGQLALFIAGASSRTSFGDLTLSNRSTSAAIPDLRMYYGDVGGSPPLQSNSVGQFAANATFLFPSVLKNMFGQSDRTGTLQLRSAQMGNVSVSQTQVNANFGQTYGTALPVFRSDRGFGPGESFFLPGVQKSGTLSTTIYLQEIAGAHSDVTMDLLNSDGVITNGGSPKSLSGFGSVELRDSVPAGIVSVRLTNTSAPGSGGLVNGYAIVSDSATGDSFVVVQLTPAAGADPMFSPAFASTTGSTVLHLTNAQASGAISVSATAVTGPPVAPRHRSVKGLSAGNPVAERALTIPPIGPLASYQLTLSDSGFVKLTGSTALRVAGRYSIPRSAGTFGTAVPVVPGSRALKLNEQVRFTGVEDSSTTTVGFARPLTYSTDLMLVETTGLAKVTVKVTLRYVFSAAKVAGSSAASQQFDVPAGSFIVLTSLGKSLLGSQRNSYGDLHNAVLDVEVISGSGAVLPFLKSTDNGTGDISIRND